MVMLGLSGVLGLWLVGWLSARRKQGANGLARPVKYRPIPTAPRVIRPQSQEPPRLLPDELRVPGGGVRLFTLAKAEPRNRCSRQISHARSATPDTRMSQGIN